MKKLYEFEINKIQEIEEIETTKNEKGEEVRTIKKVKKPTPHKFFLKKPTRSLFDEADLYYGVRLAEGIKAGMLTRVLLAKRFSNDGGVMSEPEKKRYSELFYKTYQEQNEFQKLSLKDESEKTAVEKARYEELIVSITSAKEEIQEFELAQQSLFDQTAENRARNQTILWWVLQLSYKYNDKGEPTPLFEGETLEQKLEKYDALEESEDEFSNLVARKVSFFVSFWYVGKCQTEEDFKKIDKVSSPKEEDKEEDKETDQPPVEEKVD